MEKAGCINYSQTPWESEKGDVYERQVCYKFAKRISRHGGEARSTQQRSPSSDGNGWTVEEVMTLHGIPLGDYFNVQYLYGFFWISVYIFQFAIPWILLSIPHVPNAEDVI